MNKVILIAVLILSLAGCSTLGISTDTKAKVCTDAQALVSSAQVALTNPSLSDTQKQQLNWDLAAAQAIVTLNCGASK